jgi:hypothetical protein
MSAAEPPNPWRRAQLDLQAIEAETDWMRSLGLDTLAQASPSLRYLSRRHVTKEA